MFSKGGTPAFAAFGLILFLLLFHLILFFGPRLGELAKGLGEL